MGYALYVQDNIKENDYFRTTTGEIFQVAGVKEGKVYYAFGEHCWVDSIAITNFQENIIDLIEVGDYVNGKYVKEINQYKDGKSIIALIGIIDAQDIKTILTKEQYQSNCYTVEEG